MANKVLNSVENFNKPLVDLMISRGWYLRLKNKKTKGGKFKQLSSEEKRTIKN